MATLAQLCGIYPVVEAICENLHFVDLLRLSQVHPAIHFHLTNSRIPPVSPKQDNDHFAPHRHRPNPNWSNLARKTSRACQDPAHVERPQLDTKNARLWIRHIRESLGCPSAQPCRGCEAYVCFPCWWGRITLDCRRVRGNRRGQPACHACWTTPTVDFGANDRRKVHIHRGSLQDAYEMGLFCDCGPAFFCSECAKSLDHRTAIRSVDSNGHVASPCSLDLRRRPGSTVAYERGFNRGEEDGYIKCSICPVVLHPSDTEPIRAFCNVCKLPMRMRRHDHALQAKHLSTQDPLRFPGIDAGLSGTLPPLTDSRGHTVYKIDTKTGRRSRVVCRTEGYSYPETVPNTRAFFNLSTHYEDFEEHWKTQSYFWVKMVDLKGGNSPARLEADDGVPWEHQPRKDVCASDALWKSYWNVRSNLSGRPEEGDWHKRSVKNSFAL
jgi:hypothetical protein